MQKMSVAGAILVLENGLCYENVSHIESTEAYHYFSTYIQSGETSMKHEIRIDAEINIDDQFHIQARSWGAEYWQHIDSVATDWSSDDDTK